MRSRRYREEVSKDWKTGTWRKQYFLLKLVFAAKSDFLPEVEMRSIPARASRKGCPQLRHLSRLSLRPPALLNAGDDMTHGGSTGFLAGTSLLLSPS